MSVWEIQSALRQSDIWDVTDSAMACVPMSRVDIVFILHWRDVESRNLGGKDGSISRRREGRIGGVRLPAEGRITAILHCSQDKLAPNTSPVVLRTRPKQNATFYVECMKRKQDNEVRMELQRHVRNP